MNTQQRAELRRQQHIDARPEIPDLYGWFGSQLETSLWHLQRARHWARRTGVSKETAARAERRHRDRYR